MINSDNSTASANLINHSLTPCEIIFKFRYLSLMLFSNSLHSPKSMLRNFQIPPPLANIIFHSSCSHKSMRRNFQIPPPFTNIIFASLRSHKSSRHRHSSSRHRSRHHSSKHEEVSSTSEEVVGKQQRLPSLQEENEPSSTSAGCVFIYIYFRWESSID